MYIDSGIIMAFGLLALKLRKKVIYERIEERFFLVCRISKYFFYMLLYFVFFEYFIVFLDWVPALFDIQYVLELYVR